MGSISVHRNVGLPGVEVVCIDRIAAPRTMLSDNYVIAVVHSGEGDRKSVV